MRKAQAAARWVALCVAAVLLASCRSAPEAPATSEYWQGGEKLLHWSGKVRGRVRIAFWADGRFNEQLTQPATLQDVMRTKFADLPESPGFCYVERIQGDRTAVAEQPMAENEYRCMIEVQQRGSASEPYEFNLYYLGTQDLEQHRK